MRSTMTFRFVGPAAFFTLIAAAHGEGLKIGDAAPRLSIGKWIGGDAVDITKADPADVFVITFWQPSQHFSRFYTSTMTHVQKQFKDRRVRVIAVTAEQKETVQNFLDSGWRRGVRFTIGVDQRGRTARRWEAAPDISPMVATYIVKDGRITWVGQHLEGLDTHVAEALGDEAYVADARKYESRLTRFNEAYKAEQWDKALSILDKLMAFKPNDTRLNNSRYIILANKKRDAKAAEPWKSILLARCEDAYALNELAWGILTEDMWRDCRDLSFAKAVAEKAMALTDHRNAAIVDTYARALWDTGDWAGAIEWQKKALELCKVDPTSAEFLGQIQETLEAYQNRINRGI